MPEARWDAVGRIEARIGLRMMIELHLISSFDGLSRHLLALCFGDESLEEEEKLEDDAFIEDSEEEDTDLADIFGGDIEKEEET